MDAVTTLESEIARIQAVARKQKIDLEKPRSFMAMAQKVGLEREYKGLYKLFSKYVHPSSYTVNGAPDEIDSQVVRNILLIQAQLYAADTFGRLKEATSGHDGE